jgi:plasmid maintenance system antidote protein VapI
MRLVPPSEILSEEFLKPLSPTANALGKALLARMRKRIEGNLSVLA